MFQQTHLPKDKDATPTEQWGWSIQDFLTENFWYLLGILFILFVFFYARYSWRKRHEKNQQ